jgi:hypothetical protein
VYDEVTFDRISSEDDVDSAVLYLLSKCRNIKHIRFGHRVLKAYFNTLPVSVVKSIKSSKKLEDIELRFPYLEQNKLFRDLNYESCLQCGKFFNLMNNNETSCLFHPKKIDNNDKYLCCGSKQPPDIGTPGCKLSKHVPFTDHSFYYSWCVDEFAFRIYDPSMTTIHPSQFKLS